MFTLYKHCYKNKMKSQQTGEKQISRHISDKELLCWVYKELLQHKNKKTNSSIKYRQKILKQICSY